jgi:hypothetical protein
MERDAERERERQREIERERGKGIEREKREEREREREYETQFLDKIYYIYLPSFCISLSVTPLSLLAWNLI